MRVTITPGAARGTVRVPTSKSIAHRALLAAALANGSSTLAGVTPSQDIDATCRAAAALGAVVNALPGGQLQVTGTGVLAVPNAPVDCGESGSTLRFVLPLFALGGSEVTLTGHGRLPQRPQGVYQDLFAANGLPFETGPAGVRFRGPLPAGQYQIPGWVSSQFITGLLFALPLAAGDSVLQIEPPLESRPYLDLTLDVLHRFGIKADWQGPLALAIPGGQQYRPVPGFTVEADWSQAAFFAVLVALSGSVCCTGLATNSLQGDRVIADFLSQMGAAAATQNTGALCWQKTALAPLQADLADCPDLGPILMAACCFAAGTSHITNAGRLRLKESDRIAAMQAELAKLGLTVQCEGDTLIIPGNANGRCAAPGVPLQCWGDHRIAMALAVAATRADGPVTLLGAEAVEKSYPHFFVDLQQTGIKVEIEQ